MGQLAITLLGTFQVKLEGRPLVAFETDKARALLAYLAVEAGRPHRREALAAMFWPDRPVAQARNNLRQTLYRLRQTMGDPDRENPCLLASAQEVQFNQAAGCWLDAAEFARRLTICREHHPQIEALCRSCREELVAAVGLYQGEFMAGFSLPDSPDFEWWLLANQERYHQFALEALDRLACDADLRGDHRRSAAWARRKIALEPWQEAAHREAMRALALSGQRQAALAQYERCCQILAGEMGIEPAAETRWLYEQIRSERFPNPGGPAKAGNPATSVAGRETTSSREKEVIFAGREEELARLQTHLKKALVGQGRVVFICGEAGSGKTMLAAEFGRQAIAAHDDLLVIGGSCDGPRGLGDPYQPFRESLHMLAGGLDADHQWPTPELVSSRRIAALSPAIAPVLADFGPELEGFFLPAGDAAQSTWTMPESPGLNQAALFEKVTRVYQAIARRHPLVLVLDDLQWLDTSSASLLFHLGRHLAGNRLLIVATYRREEVDWPGPMARRHPLLPVINELTRYFGEIHIDLDQADGPGFIDALLDSRPNLLDEQFRRQLHERTGGNPLFVVELLRGLRERGELVQDEGGYWITGQHIKWETLPARVEAVIAERFGRLPADCQAILSAASIQGQRFVAEVVAEVCSVEPGLVIETLSEQLDRQHHLVQARSYRPVGERCMSHFRFRHYLFQQYAYQRLDMVERASLHGVTGEALEILYTSQIDEHAQELARHFEVAGRYSKAAAYYLMAGIRAYRFSANDEALAFIRRGLDLLEKILPGPERDQLEMTLLLALCAPLRSSRGFGDPEIGRACRRAVRLAQELGDKERLFAARFALIACITLRADYGQAAELNQQLFEQAEDKKYPLHLAQANYARGMIRFAQGQFRAAQNCFEDVISMSFPGAKSFLIDPILRQDFQIAAQGWSGCILALLGHSDQAFERNGIALEGLPAMDHAHSRAFTLMVAGCLFPTLVRDYSLLKERAMMLLELAREERFELYEAWAKIYLGRGLVREGRGAEGLASILWGLDRLEVMGQKLHLTLFLAILAEALAEDTGQERALTKALAIVEETGERFYEAELHRLRGEMIVGKGDDGENLTGAEASFERALAIAREQGASLFELRAATSLARLRQRQGHPDEAYLLLEGVYRGFNGEADTPDLKNARALLVALSHQPV